MARAHRRLGYRAGYCPKADVKDTAAVKAIAEAFQREHVVIAEVGRWVNLLDADPAKRRANLETVTEGLALAEAVGALCCVDIAGSFNPDVWYGPHPDNLSERFFEAAVENARTDHRRRQADAREVLLRDDGLVDPGQPGQLPSAPEGGRSPRVRRPPGSVQSRQLAGPLLSQRRSAQRVLRHARSVDRELSREGPDVGRRDERALPRGASRQPGLSTTPRICAGWRPCRSSRR